MVEELILPEILSFGWDEGNILKTKLTHNVETLECEQIFHNDPVFIYDKNHSQQEERYFAYGISDKGRKLVIVFTTRKGKIRVISARAQSKKERRMYEKAKADTKV